MVFSEKQKKMVEQSWKLLKEDIDGFSLYFFTQVLEIEPAVKELFPFLKDADEIPKDNSKVKSHTQIIFKNTHDAATKEVVVRDIQLDHFGSVHLKNEIAARHFEVVKEALLRTLEKVGDKWCEEMKGAWSEAYDQLSAAIQAEMAKKAEEAKEMAKKAAEAKAEVTKEPETQP